MGEVGGMGEHWWDPENHTSDPLYVFPSAMSQMTHRSCLPFTSPATNGISRRSEVWPLSVCGTQTTAAKGTVEPGTEEWCAAKIGQSLECAREIPTADRQSDEFDVLLEGQASPYVQFRFWRMEKTLAVR